METPLNKIPSRIKYYLLDWKDRNLEWFEEQYGSASLHDLSMEHLKSLMIYVTSLDIKENF